MIEQAELNRAFFARYDEPSFLEGMASRAEPSFFPQKLEPKPSQAKPSFGSDPTLLFSNLALVIDSNAFFLSDTKMLPFWKINNGCLWLLPSLCKGAK